MIDDAVVDIIRIIKNNANIEEDILRKIELAIRLEFGGGNVYIKKKDRFALAEALEFLKKGVSVRLISKRTGVSRMQLYRYLNK